MKAVGTAHVFLRDYNIQGGPKKRYPNFIFAITSVNVHRF